MMIPRTNQPPTQKVPLLHRTTCIGSLGVRLIGVEIRSCLEQTLLFFGLDTFSVIQAEALVTTQVDAYYSHFAPHLEWLSKALSAAEPARAAMLIGEFDHQILSSRARYLAFENRYVALKARHRELLKVRHGKTFYLLSRGAEALRSPNPVISQDVRSLIFGVFANRPVLLLRRRKYIEFRVGTPPKPGNKLGEQVIFAFASLLLGGGLFIAYRPIAFSLGLLQSNGAVFTIAYLTAIGLTYLNRTASLESYAKIDRYSWIQGNISVLLVSLAEVGTLIGPAVQFISPTDTSVFTLLSATATSLLGVTTVLFWARSNAHLLTKWYEKYDPTPEEIKEWEKRAIREDKELEEDVRGKRVLRAEAAIELLDIRSELKAMKRRLKALKKAHLKTLTRWRRSVYREMEIMKFHTQVKSR
ncbi:MAG: hypothetical protein AAF703_12010 [Cyanobacteria bacterium P01_D01_bin.105]